VLLPLDADALAYADVRARVVDADDVREQARALVEIDPCFGYKWRS
jgi:hypothetical protein